MSISEIVNSVDSLSDGDLDILESELDVIEKRAENSVNAINSGRFLAHAIVDSISNIESPLRKMASRGLIDLDSADLRDVFGGSTANADTLEKIADSDTFSKLGRNGLAALYHITLMKTGS